MEKSSLDFQSPEITRIAQQAEEPETTNSFIENERVQVFVRIRPQFP